ncbi:MAG: 1-acyl-sn-glycerol-3-phosphate acyltransferase [Bacteroidales bacterium]|nr:1-acyl-sn-glycerol-3-phosphate acyltransferase [Bacteroidales bacterium]
MQAKTKNNIKMISFENINKPDWRYNLLYSYVHIMHNFVYYRKFYVLNGDKVPKGKPVVAISNHQNGLTDALGILFGFSKDGRHPIFIARADIFKREIAAKALRFLRIMPAFRAVDVGSSGVGENKAIFNQSAKILSENGVVALFPEAGHQNCHTLGTFKKGFARIAFSAAEMMDFKEPVYIQPMSNHYDNYFSVQGRLIVTFGEPFEFTDLYDMYKTQPHRAEKILTDRARAIVDDLMLNIIDKHYYEEYEMLCTIYGRELMAEEHKSRRYFPNQLDASKRVVKMLDKCRETDPDTFAEIMEMAHRYCHSLDKMHLRDWVFAQKLSTAGFLLRLLLCIVLTPVVIACWLLNIVPFSMSSFITRNIKDYMLHSSFHFAVGFLVSYPMWFIISGVVLGVVTGLWWLLPIYMVVLPLSLLVYLRSKVMIKKVYNRIRRFRLWFRGNHYYAEAVETRKELIKKFSLIRK